MAEMPEFNFEGLFSSVASSQESLDSDTNELSQFLVSKITIQQKMIEDCYIVEENALYPYICELREVFDTVTDISNSDLLDFDKAKDQIAQKLVTI